MNDTPAFPTTLFEHGGESNGMTLRDYFAAKALQALISEPSFKGTMDEFAHRAYAIADAMMEDRKA